MTSIGQVGLEIPKGKHALTLGMGQIKRRFMMAYANWAYMRNTGAPERIYQFGMMTHPDQNADYRELMTELMRFFGEDVMSWEASDGEPVIALVTDEELVDAYYSWEEEHPDTSSFSFDYEAHMNGEEQPYPYALEGLALGLKDAEFEERLDALSTDSLQVFKFRYREVFRQAQPGQEPSEKITGIGELLEPVYMLISSVPTTVDLSAELQGIVYMKNGDTGEVTNVNANAIEIGVVPVLIAGTDGYF